MKYVYCIYFQYIMIYFLWVKVGQITAAEAQGDSTLNLTDVPACCSLLQPTCPKAILALIQHISEFSIECQRCYGRHSSDCSETWADSKLLYLQTVGWVCCHRSGSHGNAAFQGGVAGRCKRTNSSTVSTSSGRQIYRAWRDAVQWLIKPDSPFKRHYTSSIRQL